MSASFGSRARARRGDRARILLAIVLIVFTALVGVLGWAPPAKAQEVSAATLPKTYRLSSPALTQGVPVAQLSTDADLARSCVRLAPKLLGTAVDVAAPEDHSGGMRLGRLFGLRTRA